MEYNRSAKDKLPGNRPFFYPYMQSENAYAKAKAIGLREQTMEVPYVEMSQMRKRI